MNQTSKRQLENLLIVMGLKGLTDPDLIQQLADMISEWKGDKHQFLTDLLNECDLAKRYEMYHAIAPKLKFKALPLAQYEIRIQEKAGALVSKRQARVEGEAQRPIEIGKDTYRQVHQDAATHVVLTLSCSKCPRKQRFVGETPVSAMIEARKLGWKRDLIVNKELCRKCAKKQERLKQEHRTVLILKDA